MRLFSATGNVVCRYTGSPGRTLLVLIACLSASGIFVPAGTVTRRGASDASLSLGDADSGAGGAVWPIANAEHSTTAGRKRILGSCRNTLYQPIAPREVSGCSWSHSLGHLV